MKFSTNYILYPDNKSLEKALAHYKSLISEEEAKGLSPDSRVAVADNFIHTRGNYEQHRYSANVLESARATLEALVTDKLRDESPLDWSELHNSLGNILAGLGQNLRDAGLYNLSIASFNEVLGVLSQEENPLEWAATKSNLATALQALGRQEADAKLLSNAIDEYTEALFVYSRKETPEEWSVVMFQLAATYHSYGHLLKGNRTFQKSVVAYKNALAELDADLYALELTATHNNRGSVLQHLAESEENAERLEEAIRAYETALTVAMEQQLPFHLAVLIRTNKSTARAVLAELTKDAALAEEVADEFEVIIECFPHAIQPLCLKHCEAQLEKAQAQLEEFSGS
ncbi:MAG: hypothetical protein QM484_10005 [Woeseiaceae bacterium]